MKYSYTDSLITLTAAVTQACSLHLNNNKAFAEIRGEGPSFLKLNTDKQQYYKRVGIKFDNISAGKYFELINRTQRLFLLHKV